MSQILERVNSVCVLPKDGVQTLVVYVDDSACAAALEGRGELVLLHMSDEVVDWVEVHLSRLAHSRNHPYLGELARMIAIE